MYSVSKKKSFHVHGSISPRTWSIGFMYVNRTVHARETNT